MATGEVSVYEFGHFRLDVRQRGLLSGMDLKILARPAGLEPATPGLEG